GLKRRAWSERASSSRAAAQPKSAWPSDFCHDFQPIVSPGATGEGQGIASAFGTPVDCGCNDSVVADYRRIPSGSRGGGSAGAKGAAPRGEGAGEIALVPARWARGKGAPLRVMLVTEKPLKGDFWRTGPEGGVAPPSRERQGGPPYFWFAEIKAPA